LILVLNKKIKPGFSPKKYWEIAKALLSKATKNNDLNRRNLVFFDKWRRE
jgi:hypothetical protein